MVKASLPAVSLAVVAVLAVGAIGSVALVGAQSAHRVAQQEGPASSYTPPPIASPQPSPLPVIAIIGDGSVSQSVPSVDAGKRWPAQIAASQQVRTSLFANASAGYTAAGSDGRTFIDQASRIPQDATLVMFVGGAADRTAGPVALIRAATDAIAAAKKRAPSASVLVVGSFVSGVATTGELESVNTTLQNAAAITDATFVDPLGQRWLSGAVRLTGSDLTASDERQLAGRLETATRQLLDGNS